MYAGLFGSGKRETERKRRGGGGGKRERKQEKAKERFSHNTNPKNPINKYYKYI